MGNEMSCPCGSNNSYENEQTPQHPDYLADAEKTTLSYKQMIYGKITVYI